MKKWSLLAAAILFLLIPGKSAGTDIRDLEPVAAVQILTVPEGIRIITDTGAEGYGPDLKLALENLHSSAPSRIFLDTAQYLLTDREDYLDELYPVFRPACRISLAKDQVDLELAVRYLKIHGENTTLLQYRGGETNLPVLYSKEGRSQIVL